jgi:hypothetical protein
MAQPIIVTIDEASAEVRFLISSETLCFTSADMRVKRASHVEPARLPLRVVFHGLRVLFGESGRMAEFTRHWGCTWRVNLEPVNGPILPDTFTDRAEAIASEVSWLEINFL